MTETSHLHEFADLLIQRNSVRHWGHNGGHGERQSGAKGLWRYGGSRGLGYTTLPGDPREQRREPILVCGLERGVFIQEIGKLQGVLPVCVSF